MQFNLHFNTTTFAGPKTAVLAAISISNIAGTMGMLSMHSLLPLPLYEYGRPPILGFAYQMSF